MQKPTPAMSQTHSDTRAQSTQASIYRGPKKTDTAAASGKIRGGPKAMSTIAG